MAITSLAPEANHAAEHRRYLVIGDTFVYITAVVATCSSRERKYLKYVKARTKSEKRLACLKKASSKAFDIASNPSMECDGANDSHDGAVNEGSQTGTESLKFKLRSWRTGHRREKLRKKLGEKFGKEKRVLILGGTQFMGRLTTTLLLKDGHHARASGIGETTSWNVGHYVYISSDSTYMACEVGGSPGAVTEAEGKRPAEVEAREILRRSSEYQYEYGSNKLACEEALQQASQQGGFPFTALRLADVVGPFDNIAAHL
eukprot:gene7350-8748_t